MSKLNFQKIATDIGGVRAQCKAFERMVDAAEALNREYAAVRERLGKECESSTAISPRQGLPTPCDTL